MAPDQVHNTEDDLLLQHLSEGSRAAFDALYDKYWKQVFNAAYKRLSNADHARDVAQEVFVQFWLRGTQAPIENLPAYLFVAVRNGVFKHFEKENRYAALPDQVYELENRHDRADADILHTEFLEALKQLVDTLPPQQQTIFKMRFEQDMTTLEIADALQLSVKTVRNHLGRALASLKTSLLLLNLLVICCNCRN